MLNELIDAKSAPAQMFPTRDPVRSARLMAAVDSVNGRFGLGVVRLAVSGVGDGRRRRISCRRATRPGLKSCFASGRDDFAHKLGVSV